MSCGEQRLFNIGGSLRVFVYVVMFAISSFVVACCQIMLTIAPLVFDDSSSFFFFICEYDYGGGYVHRKKMIFA